MIDCRAQLHWMKAGMLINIVDGNKDDTGWTVDRLKGYLIVEPDRLVSVTSVISQLYCERKAALSRFYMGGDSAVTFRGVVAHELICAVSNKTNVISERERKLTLKFHFDFIGHGQRHWGCG